MNIHNIHKRNTFLQKLVCFCVQVNINKPLRNVRHRYHNILLGKNITSNYRKCENGVKYRLDKVTKRIP